MSHNTGAYSKPEEFEEKSTPDNKWYDPEIRGRMTASAAQFYSEYTGLSSDELIPHLHTHRDRAWKISPWPYVGQWGFLSTRIQFVPGIESIIATLKSGGSILDLGCGLGQDLRYLAYKGAPTANMYASDLVGAFWDVGYELFRDQARFHARFTQANILEPSNPLLGNEELVGKMDVVYMGGFLHVFNSAEQLQALDAVARFSKPGTVVCGFQWGLDRKLAAPEVLAHKQAESMHDEKTMVGLWERLEEKTGTSWRTDVSLHPMSEYYAEERDYLWVGKGASVVIFRAERVS